MKPVTVKESERDSMRTLFDAIARAYDAYRPGYPDALIADIVKLSSIPAGGRILEVGCGTGQATLPFAQRGYEIIAVEMGESMAAIARQKMREVPNVEIVTAKFEDWEPGDRKFDLVISATAFHWIAPQTGYPKAAQVLRPRGAIAIFSNIHPHPFTGYFERVQSVYREVLPDNKDPNEWPTVEQVIEDGSEEIRASRCFDEPSVHRYPWSQEYDRDAYLNLMATSSFQLNLEESIRKRLQDGLGRVMDEEYGGRVTHPYLSVLHFAKKMVRS
ncbi:MAG TPA: class I SAM-dependent methyltransferase [Candidatus Binataceae bacterium]|nr:class I SAM-dependent methyltransferase [Candidatus Binataceae bacterium]